MRRGSSLLLFAFFATFALACRNEPGAPPRVSGAGAGPRPAVAIVESVPVETSHSDSPPAHTTLLRAF